ncbi:hypothetical protein EMWEY_00039810 [Eimeria maxima]|uniref:Myosin heavy chain n=1 Tax=Eimeria maxima TaxID=5804 RepID=U6MBA9_EIMMA|nr:hypothetical protein EMWEY_00039810 [Eimeria maxima]CDJ61311.1 hypothetical protein EMWEY_00039810 [Eimeria maxima]
MCKRKLIKRLAAPAVQRLRGRTKAPLFLSLLLLLVLVCHCSSSAASQNLDFFDEGLQVDEGQDISIAEAAAATPPVGDAGDGEGPVWQMLNKGLGPVNMEWIRAAGKKVGWHALGSAAAVVLLAVFVTARMFGAAGRREQVGGKQNPQDEEEYEDEGEEEEVDGEGGAAQLALLRRLQRCVTPAASLVATLKAPIYDVHLNDMKRNIENAVEYQSAAEVGEPGAVAALAAANQQAAHLARLLQDAAMSSVSTNAWSVTSCNDAEVSAGAAVARSMFKRSGVSSSYKEAWDLAVGVCDTIIRTLREEARTLKERLPSLPSLEQKQQLLQPRRIYAERVAVEAARSLQERQTAATQAAKQLRKIYLKLVKSTLVVETELQAAKLALQGRIASSMLEAALSKVAGRRQPGSDEQDLMDECGSQYRDAEKHLRSMQEQLEVLKDKTDLLDITRAASVAARASNNAATLLQGVLRKQSKFLSSRTSLGAEELPNGEPGVDDLVSGVKQIMDLQTAMKPIVEAVTATEKQVLEVGQQVEMQLSGLKDLPWVPQLLLENSKKLLKSALVSAKVTREAVQRRVVDMSESAPRGIVELLDAIAADTSALKDQCKALWQLNAEVEMLVLLKGMVANAEKHKEAALGMIAGSKFLQPAHKQRAGELKKQLEHAVTTARRADRLSAFVEAVGQCASASEGLLQLALKSKLDVLLKNDTAAAAEV